jgi:hypothetical protein
MSGEIRVDPPSLRRLADDLTDVVDALRDAQNAIIGSEVSPAAFSPSGVPLAFAFAGAIEFAGSDAYEQAEQVGSIQARLHKTAAQWEAAEEQSTVQEC